MATVLEEPLERTQPTERQEGDVLTSEQTLRDTLSPGRMRDLFDEACNALAGSFEHLSNQHPVPPEIVAEACKVFAEHVGKQYQALDDPCGNRHEEQELFRRGYKMAADMIPRLLKPHGNETDTLTVDPCAMALGLLERRLRDGFLKPMSFDTHEQRNIPRIRTSHANLERVVAECFTHDAQIYYYLDCARMHVDHVLANRLSENEIEKERWGARGNLRDAEKLIEERELAQRENVHVLRCCFRETMEYVCEHLDEGPLTEAA